MSTLLDYITSLSHPHQLVFFQHPYTIFAIVKSIPSLHKSFLYRFLWLNKPVPSSSTTHWIHPQSLHKSVLLTLTSLHLLLSQPNGYVLNPPIANALRSIVLSPSIFHLHAQAFPETDVLLIHSKSRFDVVTKILTGSKLTSTPRKRSRTAKKSIEVHQKLDPATIESTIASLCHSSGLTATLPTATESATISGKGFTFLLTPKRDQLWSLIIASLSGYDDVSLKSMLLETPTLTLTTTHLCELLLSSTSHETCLFGQTEVADYVTVESNYKVFVHSSDPLLLSILELFLHIHFILPDLVACSLTRESVSRAFLSGISSEVIINFLKLHAHPVTGKRKDSVPMNVIEHIQLWESEMHRVEVSDCVFFSEVSGVSISGNDIFDEAVAKSKELNGLLWKNEEERSLIVKKEIAGVIQSEVFLI
ncbi:hypothetical protein GEMRC1_007070 [Eukaryota sp. GEM-RC1]